MQFFVGLRRFVWTFILADVDHAIIGCDFLSHFDLSVRPSCRKIVDNSTRLAAIGEESCSSVGISVCLPDCQAQYKALLDKFPNVTSSPFVKQEVCHEVTHRIITNGGPVFCRLRRLDVARMKVVKEEFQYMLDQGIIRTSRSSFASALHMVPKPVPGSWRPCGDFRALNRLIPPDRYPIPYLRDFNSMLHGSKIFFSARSYKGILSDSCPSR